MAKHSANDQPDGRSTREQLAAQRSGEPTQVGRHLGNTAMGPGTRAGAGVEGYGDSR